METTPNSIKLRVRRLLLKARNNALKLTDHGIRAIRADSDQLHPPTRADDIKNAHDEVKHFLAGVGPIYEDGDKMKVVEFPIDMDSNAVVEVRFAVMG